MVGSLATCGRVAAVTLLALSGVTAGQGTAPAATATASTRTTTTSSSGTSGGNCGQAGTTTGPTTDVGAADGMTTAAQRFGWGRATRSEDFDGDLSGWGVHDGPGHAARGRRSPAAISVADGVLTISGDAAGTTGGMAWLGGEKYGRWEARVRSPAADPTYNAVVLLWPDTGDRPVR